MPSLSSDEPASSYREWSDTFDTLRPSDRALISAHIAAAALPELLVIWYLPSETTSALDAASSLVQQLCNNWRAILVGEFPESTDLDELLKADARVSICRNPSEAELGASRAPYFLLIKGAGKLADHATYMFGVQGQSTPGAVYCDEDVAFSGRRHSPRFAPAYSPEFSAIGSVVLAPRSTALAASLANTPGHEIDLPKLLSNEVSTASIPISHIPFILFHSRNEPALDSPELEDYLKDGDRIPKISIIIPTKDRLDLLEPCVRSILAKTAYPRDQYEIVIVDNGSHDPATLDYLDEMAHSRTITVLRDRRPFNYSRLNNYAVASTNGELLAFLNNDTVVLDPLWLRRLAFYAMKPGVGAVGGKLLYPDMTVQHGGVVLGIQGLAAHAHHNLQADEPGYLGLCNATHAVSAVTGACLVLKRSAFCEVGGFDENLAVAFGDVLLCIELTNRGYRNIYLGHPLLIHFESRTRGYDDTPMKQRVFLEEARYARRKHQALFKNDPYYNDNLSLEKAYGLAFPPRAEKPWNTFRRQSTGQLRLLMLSCTHEIGHGVPVVLNLQARHLSSRGHRVFVGGPLGKNDVSYPGCTRVILNDPKSAATFVVRHDIDCVVMHTPPFYSTTRWLGAAVKTVAYDYGEPSPDFFPDAAVRKLQLQEKSFCLEMADSLYAISDAVKAEAAHPRMDVIPLGNSHLAQWDENLTARSLSP
jgi:GT2 family glycosyltransferase